MIKAPGKNGRRATALDVLPHVRATGDHGVLEHWSTEVMLMRGVVIVVIGFFASILPATAQEEPETWAGLVVSPEHRCAPYSRSDYRYSSRIKQQIQDEMGLMTDGGWYGIYDARVFTSDTETHIEHIVALSEAHDSGMCDRTLDEKRAFANDLNNLTLASPALNRRKAAKDAGEWMPPNARCWFARTVVSVKRAYELTIDDTERRELERVISVCRSGVVPDWESGASPRQAAATPRETAQAPQGQVVDAINALTSQLVAMAPARPGQECGVAHEPSWTKPEAWAWERICEGRPVDFAEFDDLPFDPKRESFDGATVGRRTLRSAFLETVLLHDPFRNAIPRQGVHIDGAYFPDLVDLADASIKHPLLLQNSRFDQSVSLLRMTTPTFISFAGSRFVAGLDMRAVVIGGGLVMDDGEFDGVQVEGVPLMEGVPFPEKPTSVRMGGAQIGEALTVNRSTFQGSLYMDSVSIGNDFVMRASRFQEVYLRGMQVGDQLAIVDSTFSGEMELDSAVVGGDFLIHGQTEFESLVLTGTQIGDQLSMLNIEVNDMLSFNAASIGGSLLMRGAVVSGLANLRFLSVGRNIDASGTTLKVLDLTGAQIQGVLRLGDDKLPTIDWESKKSEVILQNAHAGALDDTQGSWPERLELDGFVYGRLDRIGDRLQAWHSGDDAGGSVEWLARDSSYTPQPYQHLASLLRAAGHESMADDVLFASREREWGDAQRWSSRWWHLLVLRSVIGYGYGWRMFFALFWLGSLVVVGRVVLLVAREEGDIGFWYSLDMVLPVVRLKDQHYTVDLKTWAQYYFYVHQMSGYLLLYYVIMGLSGLSE